MGAAAGMLAEGREHVGWWSVVVVEELEKAWPNYVSTLLQSRNSQAETNNLEHF